jgi:hyperosmotically inducible periplasmic protein
LRWKLPNHYSHSNRELTCPPDVQRSGVLFILGGTWSVFRSVKVIMISRFCRWLMFIFSAGVLSTALLTAQQPSTSAGQADNTKANQRDRNGVDPTADQQQNDRSDREITQQIRKAISEDKDFSVYAHNIKVITQGGKVTLKGVVRSDQEKQAIEAKADAIAGLGNVTSDLSVKP